MTPNRDNQILLDLKYCERCGSLFFRDADSDHRLCAPCTQQSAKSPSIPISGNEAPARKPAARANLPWYGPMTETVHRIDAVATGGVA